MNNTNLSSILFAATAFATGMIAGLFLSPKTGRGNRAWINENAKEATDWVDRKSREAMSRGEEKLQHFTGRIREGLNESMPEN
ncbi:MAG: YtxH domain-containing protein [Balneolaceae bacterium]